MSQRELIDIRKRLDRLEAGQNGATQTHDSGTNNGATQSNSEPQNAAAVKGGSSETPSAA